MGYFTPQQLAQARQMDLLTYLQTNEPQALVKVGGSTYCTREHDSLKISNGMWHWFSRGVGGRSAIDYLVIVKEYTLPQAVEAVLGRTRNSPSVFHAPKATAAKLLLPKAAENNLTVTRYLRSRGIHPAILNYCYSNKLIYETLPYHSAAFIGRDESGRSRYCNIRGTASDYKGEATGSDKHYSFYIPPTEPSDEVHLFESAIDLLSYASMQHMGGQDWRQAHLLSLAGVFKIKRKGVVPIALHQFLETHPEVRQLHLHLDNDEIGRSAAQGIREGLEDRYSVYDEPPGVGKDVNDELLHEIKTRKESKEREWM